MEKLLPPSTKQRKLTSGKSRPMRGTMRPKGSRESRNRAEYVENKQKALEESLRVVAMRKTVSHLLNWVLLTACIVAGNQEEQVTETECTMGCI